MAQSAGPAGRKHPFAKTARQRLARRPSAFKDGRQLPGDGQFQGLARLGLLNPEDKPRHVNALPAQGQHFVQAHAGIEPEPQRVPGRGHADRRSMPFFQHGSTSAGAEILRRLGR